MQYNNNVLTEAGVASVKTFKCVGTYDTGKFETDNISVRSPKGGYRSVWLHKDAIGKLSKPESDLWSKIRDKFFDAHKEMRTWKWEETKRVDAIAKERGVRFASDLDDVWKDHLKRLHERYPAGMYSFYVELTKEELALIESISDQKIGYK